MRDRKLCFSLNLTATSAAAWTCWLVATVVVLLNVDLPRWGFGFISVGLFAAAATLHVRKFIVDHDRNATAAFNLGREVGRQEGEIPVQRIH